MKRTLTIFFISLSMLLVLGHAILPHSHFLQGNTSISKPANPSLADFLKTTFSRDLGTDHLKVFKGNASKESFPGSGRETLTLLCCSTEFRDFSTSTTETVNVFQEIYECQPLLCASPLRAPPIFT